MNVLETKLPGVVIVEPKVFGDCRGFFLESFHAARYKELLGLNLDFVQDNHSRSVKGVLRGLHFQKTKPQGKLVRVTAGSVFDVAVNIDPASSDYSKWEGVVLSEENKRQLYVPPGHAHGFLVLSESADFQYKCTDYYDADDEGGVSWNDPDIGIDWPIKEPILSAKDCGLPNLKQLREMI